MKYKNGNMIEEEKGKSTNKFILKINGRYFVDFEETRDTRGKGSYCNGAFNLHSCLPADEIIVSDEQSDAWIIEGRINLKSHIDKLVSNYEYSFKTLEILEVNTYDENQI